MSFYYKKPHSFPSIDQMFDSIHSYRQIKTVDIKSSALHPDIVIWQEILKIVINVQQQSVNLYLVLISYFTMCTKIFLLIRNF